MAVKPDDQYEYKTCSMCQVSKKVHKEDDTELLWDPDEWIRESNKHLKNPDYHGLCLTCLDSELKAALKLHWIEKYSVKGPLPKWLKEF